MGSIKDRNGMDLTEAEDIKKRWQEYIEELCKKDLHDPGTISKMKLTEQPTVLTFLWKEILDYGEKVWA